MHETKPMGELLEISSGIKVRLLDGRLYSNWIQSTHGEGWLRKVVWTFDPSVFSEILVILWEGLDFYAAEA